MRKKSREAWQRLEKISNIALHRGFFFPTAEIYGGKAGFYSYGFLGNLLKKKFEQLWRKHFLEENFYEIGSNAILPKDVFKASGHLENFNDPLVECNTCHFRFRADQFIEDELGMDTSELSIEEMTDLIIKNKLKCPKCGSWHLSEVRWFNMMFQIEIGVTGTKDFAYLVPETAQNSYLAFKRMFEATRKKLPLGLATIGKAFRNEISPRQLFFRLREFHQAELQIFFDPEEIDKSKIWEEIKKKKLIVQTIAMKQEKKEKEEISCEKLNKCGLPKFYIEQLWKTQDFYINKLRISKKRFRLRELSKEERAFYNKIHFDVEIKLETLGGYKEVAGVHYRTDHDLKGHEKESKENLHVFYNNKKILPHVIEISFGIDRNLWALFDLTFKEEKERTLFSFPPFLSPITVAVFPLVSKDRLPEKARTVYEFLKREFDCFYDERGSIGRRYRRQDEIGTPFCITIDNQTLKDDTVTVRDRDTMKQERVKIGKLVVYIKKRIKKGSE